MGLSIEWIKFLPIFLKYVEKGSSLVLVAGLRALLRTTSKPGVLSSPIHQQISTGFSSVTAGKVKMSKACLSFSQSHLCDVKNVTILRRRWGKSVFETILYAVPEPTPA